MAQTLTLSKGFWDVIRKDVFHGSFTNSQMGGVIALVKACGLYNVTSLAQIAYVLATAYWETAHTMLPIREIGMGKGRAYGNPAGPWNQVYYGRGYCQITWLANYQKFAKLLNVPLVQFPDRALDLDVAADIIVYGMIHGEFTGVGLNNYINSKAVNFEQARRIINGTDHAADIAAIASAFLRGLNA